MSVETKVLSHKMMLKHINLNEKEIIDSLVFHKKTPL